MKGRIPAAVLGIAAGFMLIGGTYGNWTVTDTGPAPAAERGGSELPLRSRADNRDRGRVVGLDPDPLSLPAATGSPGQPAAVSPGVDPTPDPTAVPTVRSGPVITPNNQATYDLIAASHPDYAARLWRIADCESGGALSRAADAVAHNAVVVGAQGERSIWQIHPVHTKYDPARLSSDILYAAQAAVEVGLGQGWSAAWVTCRGGN